MPGKIALTSIFGRSVRMIAARGKTVIAWLRTIVDDPRTERVITVLIIVNAVMLGLETSAVMRTVSARRST